MSKRIVDIYVETVPENYTHTPSIIIKCKPSEVNQVAYDIRCVLIDAIDQHPQFQNVLLKESSDAE